MRDMYYNLAFISVKRDFIRRFLLFTLSTMNFWISWLAEFFLFKRTIVYEKEGTEEELFNWVVQTSAYVSLLLMYVHMNYV